MSSGSRASLASLPSVLPGLFMLTSLVTTARPYGPAWQRTASVTALGAEVLVAEKEGIRSCVWLVWRRAAVPACILSGSARSCSRTTAPRGRTLPGGLCCCSCFIVSQVRRREDCSSGCNVLTCRLSGSSALAACSKSHCSLPFFTAFLVRVPRTQES